MYEYDTSACWQIENVKTPLPYVVRSWERGKPKLNKTPERRPGKNNCSESVGSMSPFVPYARREGCSG
jgi:hypothetical protein